MWFNGHMTLTLAITTMITSCLTLSICSIFINPLIQKIKQFNIKTKQFINHEKFIDDETFQSPREIKELNDSFNKMAYEINNQMNMIKNEQQEKTEIIQNLAHDLKTPLTSVIGYLTLLRDESQISEELRKKYLSISLDKAERLEDLINEFFEITRFNLSNISLEYSTVSLTRMLEQLTYEFKPTLMSKNLKYTLNVTPNMMIRCDVNKMQRVFDNLLRNAVYYSFEDTTIEITAVQEDDYIKLKFMNHSNTIPEEKLERIFEQFYRLDTSRNSNSGRAGLGLAIAKEIVELHNGTITAHSENNIITFKVIIPIV